MTSLILRTATRYLIPLLLLFSLFLLLRGHNAPGGGFVAGLVTAAAFSLYALAYGSHEARRLLKLDPHVFVGVGLMLAWGSGVTGLVAGKPFLTGIWFKFGLPELVEVELGTPLLFDLGVYLVVIGITLLIILPLAEEQ